MEHFLSKESINPRENLYPGAYRNHLWGRPAALSTSYLPVGDKEPSAPDLSLGATVVCKPDGGSKEEIGRVRWIGRLPFVDPGWSVGVEFERPLGSCNGNIAGKQLFVTKSNHASFFPVSALHKTDVYCEKSCNHPQTMIASSKCCRCTHKHGLSLDYPRIATLRKSSPSPVRLELLDTSSSSSEDKSRFQTLVACLLPRLNKKKSAKKFVQTPEKTTVSYNVIETHSTDQKKKKKRLAPLPPPMNNTLCSRRADFGDTVSIATTHNPIFEKMNGETVSPCRRRRRRRKSIKNHRAPLPPSSTMEKSRLGVSSLIGPPSLPKKTFSSNSLTRFGFEERGQRSLDVAKCETLPRASKTISPDHPIAILHNDIGGRSNEQAPLDSGKIQNENSETMPSTENDDKECDTLGTASEKGSKTNILLELEETIKKSKPSVQDFLAVFTKLTEKAEDTIDADPLLSEKVQVEKEIKATCSNMKSEVTEHYQYHHPSIIRSFPTKWKFNVQSEGSPGPSDLRNRIRKSRDEQTGTRSLPSQLVCTGKPPLPKTKDPLGRQVKAASLFSQLNVAIANGRHDRAAVLARELAKNHGAISKRKVVNEVPDPPTEKTITVSLYVEDKNSHQGPIPMSVYSGMTVKMLKEKVEREFRFASDCQRWINAAVKTFVVHDTLTLGEMGVCTPGCPIFLYIVSPDRQQETDSASEMATLAEAGTSNSGKDRSCNPVQLATLEEAEEAVDDHSEARDHPDGEMEEERKEKNYLDLVQLEEQDLVPNVDHFECPICFGEVELGSGTVLRDCLHSFCKECLSQAVEYCEEAVVKCPFRNDLYVCDSQLQEREIKALVSGAVYERHLQRSVMSAESKAEDSFHCKSPDCTGWCLYDQKRVSVFPCPVCGHQNCLACMAIHEGRTCEEFRQDTIDLISSSGEDSQKTTEYLEKMVSEGQAMRCPTCKVIVMKKWGCDWLKCSVCQTEICWVTKGPRWGPKGRGDISGGCRCGVNAVRCHPQCNYCH